MVFYNRFTVLFMDYRAIVTDDLDLVPFAYRFCILWFGRDQVI